MRLATTNLPVTPAPLPPLRGLPRDLGPAPSKETIDEARREMWANEIVYLEEKRKIRAGAAKRIRQACEADLPNIEIVDVGARIVYGLHEVARTDVPDMPDRIIAATAAALNVPLVPRDGRIRASGVRTIRA